MNENQNTDKHPDFHLLFGEYDTENKVVPHKPTAQWILVRFSLSLSIFARL